MSAKTYTGPGRYQTPQAFRAHLQSIDAALDLIDEPGGPKSALGKPLAVGDRVLGNRITAQPMEGWDGTATGLPTAHTFRRWRRFGRSGAKLVWGGEAFAVSQDGRANPNQLFLNDAIGDAVESGLATLRAEVLEGHAEVGESTDDLMIGLQLTHSGRFANPAGQSAPRVAYQHPVLDDRLGVTNANVLTDADLTAIAARYVATATAAGHTGFDFVDVKACHGYLMHELLGARSRRGPYGGDFDGRTRLFREIVEGIRAACPGLGIAVRISIVDVPPFTKDPDTGTGVVANAPGLDEHGFGIDGLDEPFRFLELVTELGIQLVNLTIGSPYTCPHLQRPAAYPPSDGYGSPIDPLAGVARHLLVGRSCKRAFPDLIFIGSGYSYLQEWLPHVAEYELTHGHTDSVGLGRMLLSYPELLHDVLRGRAIERKRLCRTFSDCTTGPRNGMISGCFPLDPYYRALPEAALIRAVKRK
ncbi:MAG: NADH:flavin oxidoreductase [Planctomycetota bacterium]|jgi:2,4-dienoyl-CoA reductase-like NADH-dependent reductase (Old Yellow Enzyme family)|nr:NADH:flavin oxidoreductase [Planctomycetota bacterium]